MLKDPKIIFLLIIFGVSVLLYLIHIWGANNIADIKNNIEFGDAYVNFVRNYGKRGAEVWTVEYDYQVKGKVITDHRSVDKAKYGRNYFLCKHFPVVYSSRHTYLSDLLIDKEDSIKYGIISVWGELQKLPNSK